jgi:hypothetical protein
VAELNGRIDLTELRVTDLATELIQSEEERKALRK